jgi:hypothetical protein
MEEITCEDNIKIDLRDYATSPSTHSPYLHTIHDNISVDAIQARRLTQQLVKEKSDKPCIWHVV